MSQQEKNSFSLKRNGVFLFFDHNVTLVFNVMKFFIVLFLLNFSLLAKAQNFTSQTTQSQDELSVHKPTEVLESDLLQAEKSIWRIETFSGRATGFFIDSKHFVTNLHVIANVQDSDIKHIRLSQKDNPSVFWVNKVLAVSVLYDLAILETEESSSHYLSLRENPVETSENLFISGYPFGSFKRIGNTGNIHHEDAHMFSYFIDHSSLEGASGSPILDNEGHVVGVLFGGTLYKVSIIKIKHLRGLIVGDIGRNCNEENFIKCQKKSFNQFKSYAYKNNFLAQYQLGAMYYYGEGVEQDFEESFKWIHKSAMQNHPPAQYLIGKMYYYGEGVERDVEESFKWVHKSAMQDYYLAQYFMGNMYYYGKGVEQDVEESFKWFHKSAQQNHLLAQYQLGIMYYYGEGVEQDFEESFKWLHKSAMKDHPPAQYLIGKMYYYGEGVERDVEESFKWVHKSAQQDYSLAKGILELMLHDKKMNQTSGKSAIY